ASDALEGAENRAFEIHRDIDKGAADPALGLRLRGQLEMHAAADRMQEAVAKDGIGGLRIVSNKGRSLEIDMVLEVMAEDALGIHRTALAFKKEQKARRFDGTSGKDELPGADFEAPTGLMLGSNARNPAGL